MDADHRRLLRRFLIELVLYGILVVIYLLMILQGLSDLLADLFQSNPTVYAVVALLLILIQGWILESLTSFLLERLALE